MRISLPTLSLRQWIQILIVVTLGVSATSQYVLNYRYIQQQNAAQIEEMNTLISSNMHTMMKFPLATNDIQGIKSITADLMTNEIIWAIEVRDVSNKIVERKERSELGEKFTLVRKKIKIVDERTPLQIDETSSSNKESTVLLGTVVLYFTNEAQFNALNSELQQNSLIFAGITLILTLIIATLFLNISRSVNKANSEMEKVIHGEYDIQIPRTRVREFNSLASKLEEMAKTIYEKVEELKQSKLIAQKRQVEAEDSNASQIKFMQIVSHEIRSPVHVLVNTLRTLSNEVEKLNEPKFNNMFGLMKGSADELQSAVDEMLDVHAFESGQVQLKLSEQTVNSTILDVCARFRQKMAIKNLEFVYQDFVPREDYQAEFDKGKVDRVLTNLLENACKYTQKGSVSVSWNVKERHSEEVLVIEVTDSGIGISANDQLKIFDRFYQVKSTSVRQQSGRGIGLSIVKQLVELMSGEIELKSNAGMGREFNSEVHHSLN